MYKQLRRKGERKDEVLKKKSHWRKGERKVTWPFTSMRIDLTRERQLRSFCCSAGRSFAVLISGSMSRGYFVILVVTVRMHSGMPIFLRRGLLLLVDGDRVQVLRAESPIGWPPSEGEELGDLEKRFYNLCTWLPAPPRTEPGGCQRWLEWLVSGPGADLTPLLDGSISRLPTINCTQIHCWQRFSSSSSSSRLIQTSHFPQFLSASCQVGQLICISSETPIWYAMPWCNKLIVR